MISILLVVSNLLKAPSNDFSPAGGVEFKPPCNDFSLAGGVELKPPVIISVLLVVSNLLKGLSDDFSPAGGLQLKPPCNDFCLAGGLTVLLVVSLTSVMISILLVVSNLSLQQGFGIEMSELE